MTRKCCGKRKQRGKGKSSICQNCPDNHECLKIIEQGGSV